MFFLLTTFFHFHEFFEYVELNVLFPIVVDPLVKIHFERLSAYSLMSHCNAVFLNDSPDAGGLHDALSDSNGKLYAAYFESSDRMQLIFFTKNDPIGDEITFKNWFEGNLASNPVVNIISARATVFMDLLLFRRNMQAMMARADEVCASCKVHLGYYNNFLALVPYFSLGAGASPSFYGDPTALVGASAGGVIALLGAVTMAAAPAPSYNVAFVHTSGMPRPGNKALSRHVLALSFPCLSFVYYRDPMPHMPPTFLGYRQANNKYSWLYRSAGGFAAVSELRSSGMRNPAGTDEHMDARLANQIWFFRLMDHQMYFATEQLMWRSRSIEDVLSACGQFSDYLLVEYHTSDLFNF